MVCSTFSNQLHPLTYFDIRTGNQVDKNKCINLIQLTLVDLLNLFNLTLLTCDQFEYEE